jgi:ATP-dependent Clp protease, protease subunit
MTLRKLPEIKALDRPRGYSWDVPSDALARWTETPQAAAQDDGATITVYDMIGEDAWTGGGFTAKRMSAALRSIGARDVTVKINSPGGDVFEGFAIYNELRQHRAKVNVQVMGIAASAAAYIAMAGDEISMGLGSFMMVHNSWGMVVGNRHDMAEAITVLAVIDAAQTDIFEARTGLPRAELAKFLDAETFFSASDAVKHGFADAVMDGDGVGAQAKALPHVNARRKLDALLAQAGVSRVERRRMLSEAAGGTQNAAPTVTQDAGLEVTAALGGLLSTLRS